MKLCTLYKRRMSINSDLLSCLIKYTRYEEFLLTHQQVQSSKLSLSYS